MSAGPLGVAFMVLANTSSSLLSAAASSGEETLVGWSVSVNVLRFALYVRM